MKEGYLAIAEFDDEVINNCDLIAFQGQPVVKY